MEIVTASNAIPRGKFGGRAFSPYLASVLEHLQKLKPGKVLQIPFKGTDYADIRKMRTAITGLVSRSTTPDKEDMVTLEGTFLTYVTEDNEHVSVSRTE